MLLMVQTSPSEIGYRVSFETNVESWWATLPTERQDEVRSTRGLIPRWLRISLADAHILVVPVQIDNGIARHGFLMLTALREFVDGEHVTPVLPAAA